MTRNKIFLAIAMLARIGTGFVSLFVLARSLGPTDYGFVATVFACSSIAALLTDFGFSVQALRDIGAEPDRAGELTAACIRVKNLLVGAATVAALVALVLVGLKPHLFWASFMLYASIVVLSYGDLAMVALRGIGRYDTESYAVVAGTIAFVVIVGGVAVLWAEILSMAAALLAARLVQAIIAFMAVKRHVKLVNCIFGPLIDIMRFARNSSALALDSILTTVSGQLDVIFVSAILGLEAAGVYQVAARLTSYVLLPIQVLAGVYTPTLAMQHRNATTEFQATNWRMKLEFAGLGLLVGGFVALIVPWIVGYLFGAKFHVDLWVWVAFGILVVLKFVAASLGIALTARRGVVYRVAGQAAAVLTICVSMSIALMSLGVLGAPVVMCVATLVTMIIYWWAYGIISRIHS